MILAQNTVRYKIKKKVGYSQNEIYQTITDLYSDTDLPKKLLDIPKMMKGSGPGDTKNYNPMCVEDIFARDRPYRYNEEVPLLDVTF
jgi:hypothetical protein